MQIRYQNVWKNITNMLVSFAFMKRCLKVPIRVLAPMLPPWIVKSKKVQKNFKNNLVAKNDKCFKCLPSFIRESWLFFYFGASLFLFWSADYFFCRSTHECYSLMKLGRHLKHLSFFATKLFLNFFRFYYSWW